MTIFNSNTGNRANLSTGIINIFHENNTITTTLGIFGAVSLACVNQVNATISMITILAGGMEVGEAREGVGFNVSHCQ